MEINKKNLMIVGPTEIEEDILNIGSEKMMYNRTPEFSLLMKRIHENLKYAFQTKNTIYTFVSSGTGAMEAAIANTFSSGDKVIVIARGQWGLRWAEIAKSYKLEVNIIKLEWEEQIEPEKLKELLTDDIKGVFINSNETTVGLTTDVAAIGEIVSKSNALFVVDAISSIGAEDFRTDEWGCDMVIGSSQKGFALPPGLSFICMSQKARDRIELSDLPKYYFNIAEYEANVHRGQTPWTPATGILYQLDMRLKKIKGEGIQNVVKRHTRLSGMLRAGVSAIGIKFTGKNMSNGVTGMLAPEGINAREIVNILREKFDIEIPPSPGELEKKVFRAGVFGNIKDEDIFAFLRALESALIELGYPVTKGAAGDAARGINK
jgi:serine---pyruvate transaminase